MISPQTLSGRVSIQLRIDPAYSAAPSPMDVDARAAVVALGCYSVYLESYAAQDGFTLTKSVVRPGASSWDVEVSLEFEPIHEHSVAKSYSTSALAARWTDRREYTPQPCAPELKARMSSIVSRYPEVQEISIAAKRELLIRTCQGLEILRWRNRRFRDALFDEIDFSRGESPDSDRKIPASQLGVGGMDLLLLRAMHRFPRLRKILELGGAELIASKTVGPLFRASSGISFLQTRTDSEDGAFELGRCFQELWLTINDYGYSFQPIGLPLIAYSFWRGDPHGFRSSRRHTRIVERASQELKSEFCLDLQKLALGFRFGETKFPRVRALSVGPRADVQVEIN